MSKAVSLALQLPAESEAVFVSTLERDESRSKDIIRLHQIGITIHQWQNQKLNRYYLYIER
jgi:hypothetical protein